MSITEELRKWWVRKFPVMDEELHDDFTAIAGRIDAAHANLEAENESLRRELDRVLGEMEDRDGWVRLPKDADGVPVRLNDLMEWTDHTGDPFEVIGIGNGTLYYVEDDGIQWTRAETKRHHQPDTWERIIEDATALGAQMGRRTTQVDDLVARCKALAGDAE